MTLNFDNYDVDIDVEATRRAHSRLPRTSEKCGCAGCRNFTLAIGDALGEGGRRFLASVGIDDLAKATESYVNFVQRDGTLCYGGWCHLCGRIRRRFEAVPDATSAEWGEARERRVGERAHISFVDGRKIIGREAAFGDAAIVQMEFVAWGVPWVLDEPNPYPDE
ncbi:hypothetical protein ADJ70_11500 [Olsenella sp. oral taxon 807]|uniref:hypothetical protein n=1 Tax=Olsenella sp. oral taxon 807 TaxID=712411 RepID=UPI00067A20F7|nr:hypothetical protein [Olsenella sp. oral taxon 807]AKT49428.1 hypothetical protein ADJ70_11500 [Olsenella sp. oral taxon 807]